MGRFRDAPQSLMYSFEGSVSPFFASGFLVHRILSSKMTVFLSLGPSPVADHQREVSLRVSVLTTRRADDNDAPLTILNARGSILSGMRPRRWERTSSWTIDVLSWM